MVRNRHRAGAGVGVSAQVQRGFADKHKKNKKLRPVIDAGDLVVTLPLEHIESGEHEMSTVPTTIGAIPWTLVVSKRTKDDKGEITEHVQVALECFEGQKNQPGWKAKVNVEITLVSQRHNVASKIEKFQHVYHEHSKKQVVPKFALFSELRDANSAFLKSKKFTVVAKVKVLRVSFNCFPFYEFSSGGDVILQVKNAEYHVNKQYLATHSAYFNTLFFGEFAESQKAKIELHGVEPRHFAEFLKVIYPCRKQVKASTVRTLLNLSRMYDTQMVRALCEEYLCQQESHKEFGFKEKLLMADEYNLRQLKVTVMKSLNKKSAIEKIMADPKGLQQDTLEMICRKMTQLNELQASGVQAMDVDTDEN